MQYEEFDNKVREAADNHHPAYDEKAWAKMEKLLDKHLPQKKDDRRRIIFFLLLLLLLGGSAWMLVSEPWKENKQTAAAKPAIEKPGVTLSEPVSKKEGNSKENNVGLNKEKDFTNKVLEDRQTTGMINQLPEQITITKNRNNEKNKTIDRLVTVVLNKKTINNKPVPDLSSTIKVVDKSEENNRQSNNPVDAGKANTPDLAVTADQKNKNKNPVSDDNTPMINNTNTRAREPVNKENPNKDIASLVQNPSVKKMKNKGKKSNSFFFTLSAGPDFSAAGGGKLGTTKLLAGGGVGFTFKERLTIRTGFYRGRKVYTASPDAYHPPASFYTYYPYLQKVDADCKVYEIPLSFSYNFGHSSKQKWFASTGLSTYLMKSETYNYFYKNTASGPTMDKEWAIQNENKHYFSVLTLSGGYQRNIGKNISFMVEPYMKLSLSGVGYGKVKLNSGGLLFSIGIKPSNNLKSHNKSQH